ncbi:MAG: winged helix-turn-helix domain-containing protein [Patescibacteria group bacterium]
MTFLQKYSSLFGFDKLGDHIFVYVNENELIENTPEAYFELINYSFFANKKQEKKHPFFLLKEKTSYFIEKNCHVIFILSPQFDNLDLPLTFFNNLHSLWQLNRTKIHFIFVITKNIIENNLDKYGELKKPLCENIIYFPLTSVQDKEVMANNLCKRYHYSISRNLIKTAQKLSGGHPALMKSCLEYLNKNKSSEGIAELLMEQKEVNAIFDDIWRSLWDEDRKILEKLVEETNKTIKVSNNLIKLGLVKSQKEKTEIFSPLLKIYLKRKKPEENALSIDFEKNEILINGAPPKIKITLSEHRLLLAFLKGKNEVITRDKISEILWGNKAFDKYSDWAIDQSISLLRKKLKSLGISPQAIQTIKGRGYRFVK